MPKALPDFEDTAERFLDGELTARQEARFKSRIRNNSDLNKVLRDMKFARKALQVYRAVLPSASDFKSVRKAVLSSIG